MIDTLLQGLGREVPVVEFHDWFRNKLEANMPWDKIAYGVICATAADDREPQDILAGQKRDADEKKKLKDLQAKDKNAKLPTAERVVRLQTWSKQRSSSWQCMLAPQLSNSFDFCSARAPAAGSDLARESQPNSEATTTTRA